jgi:hypothetical protein
MGACLAGLRELAEKVHLELDAGETFKRAEEIDKETAEVQ